LATWDWQVFCNSTLGEEPTGSCFGQNGDVTYLDWLLSAWGWTLSVSSLALVVALATGILIGILRTLPSAPWRWFGNAWTELFRNIPLLVQIFMWYHVLPQIFPALQKLPSLLLVVFALGFFTSARVAEQVKAGIQALPRGQRMAGLAMGLTLAQTYRHVLLPMALRIVVPPLTSESMNIIKNSAVAFAVSIAELTMFAMQAQEETSRGVEIYLAVTGLYFVSALVVNRVAGFIERAMRVPGLATGGAK
jgi:glutamate/aspartate transport system permease protein